MVPADVMGYVANGRDYVPYDEFIKWAEEMTEKNDFISADSEPITYERYIKWALNNTITKDGVVMVPADLMGSVANGRDYVPSYDFLRLAEEMTAKNTFICADSAPNT